MYTNDMPQAWFDELSKEDTELLERLRKVQKAQGDLLELKVNPPSSKQSPMRLVENVSDGGCTHSAAPQDSTENQSGHGEQKLGQMAGLARHFSQMNALDSTMLGMSNAKTVN